MIFVTVRVLAGLSLLCNIGGGYLFSRRQSIFPIRGRQSDAVKLLIVSLCICDLSVLLRSFQWIPCPLHLWFRALGQTTAVVMYIIRAWNFLFKCKMNEKLANIRKIDILQATLEEEAIGWHTSNRFLQSRAVNFFLSLVSEAIVFFGMALAQFQDPEMQNWDLVETCHGSHQILGTWTFVLLQTFISTMLAASMSVQGAFLKSEFLFVLFSSVVCAAVALYRSFFFIDNENEAWNEDIILMAWCEGLFLCSVVFPLYLSYKGDKGDYSATSTVNVGYQSLEALLADPEGYNSFYLFLENEFSTENLLFYSVVKKFQDQVDQGHHRNLKALQDQAYRIYKSFLVPGAPYEVNVPHVARTTVAENFLKKFRRFSAIEESKRSDCGPLERNPDCQIEISALQPSTVLHPGDSASSFLDATPRTITDSNHKLTPQFNSISVENSPRIPSLNPSASSSKKTSYENSPRMEGVNTAENSPRFDALPPQTPTLAGKKKHSRTTSCPSALSLDSTEVPVTRPRDGSMHRQPPDSPKAPKEVNTDEVLAVRSIFDVPLQYVFHLMRTDSFGRYVTSDGYKQLLATKANGRMAPRKTEMPLSISESLRSFAEAKADVSISSLMDKKRDLHVKKPDWKPRTNVKRPGGGVRPLPNKKQHKYDQVPSSSSSPQSDSPPPSSSSSHPPPDFFPPTDQHSQPSTTTESSGGHGHHRHHSHHHHRTHHKKVRSESQEELIPLPTLESFPEGQTPKTKEDEGTEKFQFSYIFKIPLSDSTPATTTAASGANMTTVTPTMIVPEDSGTSTTTTTTTTTTRSPWVEASTSTLLNSNQRTEVTTKRDEYNRLGKHFFTPLESKNRRGST